jgi:hypothetical protein
VTGPLFVTYLCSTIACGTTTIAQSGNILRIYRSGRVLTWDLIIYQRPVLPSCQNFGLITQNRRLKFLRSQKNQRSIVNKDGKVDAFSSMLK